jgi:hypothetical protein
MSFGSTTTTQQSTNQSQNGQGLSVPVQLPWVAALQKSLGGSASSLVQQAGMPVFGTAQKASFLNDLNSSTTAGQNALASQLASHGALDSGAFAAGLSSLQQNRQGQIANYDTQTPILNQQAVLSNLGKALSTAGAVSSLAPTGSATSSSSTSQGTSDSTQTQNPGFGSLLGGLLGLAGGLIPGMGGLFGGSSIPPGFGGAGATGGPGGYSYTPYGAPSSMGLPGVSYTGQPWSGVS